MPCGMTRLLVIAMTAIIAMMAIAAAIGPGESTTAASTARPGDKSAPVALNSPTAAEAPEAAMVLKRDSSGQFHLNGDVNGSATRFLVDTGADVVALTEDAAQSAGLAPDSAVYQPILQTASGMADGAPVTLETLRVGERELTNVEAVVVKDLPVNLLGQNVLRKLGAVTLQGDRMVIQPR